MQSYRRAVVVGSVLGRVCFQVAGWRHLSIAHREKEEALLIECEFTSIVPATLCCCFKNLFNICELVVLPLSTDQPRRGPTIVGFRISQV